MIKPLFIFASFILFNTAHAFLISTYKSQRLNYDKATHILIAGAGKEQGTQFQEVANAKALKYAELYPHDQVVLIAKEEYEGKYGGQYNVKLIQKWGFTLQKINKSNFNGETLLSELIKFRSIASIDIFAHGTALYGVYLEDTQSRLSTQTKQLTKLARHFKKDAYVFLHGCNTGFYLAPYLSSVLKIPAAGSLTSSDFQRLHSDGSFYLTEEGYNPNNDWAKKNTSTFNRPTSCNNGLCLRLKPDNHPYHGYWGEYREGGLPFYKFFCVHNSQKDCQRTMARSLYSFIGTFNLNFKSSLKDYRNLLGDFLCPISGTRNYRRACREQLDLSLFNFDKTFNPFRGNQLECNFKKCNIEFSCNRLESSQIDDAERCYLINKSSASTTLAREYEAYMEGFISLRQQTSD